MSETELPVLERDRKDLMKIGLILVGCAIVLVLGIVLTNHFSKKKNTDNVDNKNNDDSNNQLLSQNKYLNNKEKFETKDTYHSANLCNDKVLYPIQQLAPDYGPVTIKDDCPCLEFIRSP